MTITPIMLLGGVALMSFAESLFSVAKGALLKVGVVALFAVPAYMAYSQGGLKLPNISGIAANISQAAGTSSRDQAEAPPARQARATQPERDWAPAPQARLRAEPDQAPSYGTQPYGRQPYGRQALESEDDLEEVPELQGRNRYDQGWMRPNPFDQARGTERPRYDRDQRDGYGYDRPQPRRETRRIEDWNGDGYEARPRQAPQAPIDITDARAVRRVLEDLRTGR